MVRNKKSFLLHTDSLDVLEELTDEQAGKLFKVIRAYQTDREIEVDSLTKITFSPFKNQFIRDNNKYEEVCKRRAIAGAKGGASKSSKSKQVLASASKSKQNIANLADSKKDNKNDSDSVSDSDLLKDPCEPKVSPMQKNTSFEIFSYWCEAMNKSPSTSKLTPKRDKAVKARLKEGYTVEQIKLAIDGCANDKFSMGQNDRGKPFNDLELICRDGVKLESFWHIEKSPVSGLSKAAQQTYNNLKDVDLDD